MSLGRILGVGVLSSLALLGSKSSLEQKVKSSSLSPVPTQESPLPKVVESEPARPSLPLGEEYENITLEVYLHDLKEYNNLAHNLLSRKPTRQDIDREELEKYKEGLRKKEHEEVNRKKGWEIPQDEHYPHTPPSVFIEPLRKALLTLLGDERSEVVEDHYAGVGVTGSPMFSLKYRLQAPEMNLEFWALSDDRQHRFHLELQEQEDGIPGRKTSTFLTMYRPEKRFQDRVPCANIWTYTPSPLGLPMKSLTQDYSANHPLMFDAPAFDEEERKSEMQAEAFWRQASRAVYDHFGLDAWKHDSPLIQSAKRMNTQQLKARIEECMQTGQPLVIDNVFARGVNMQDAGLGKYARFFPDQPIIFSRSNLRDSKWSFLGEIPNRVIFEDSWLLGAHGFFGTQLPFVTYDQGQSIQGLEKK